PGTETCLRVGGRVRVEAVANNFADDGVWGNRERNDINFRARGYVYLDSRTNTEFGLLRTYTSMYMTQDSDNLEGSRADGDLAAAGGESFFLEAAYIQWGGLTVGRTTSFFQIFTGQAFMGVVTRDWSDVTTNLFAYTAAFGNGFSATVALEDATFRQTPRVAYAGQNWPDIVANIRVDQGWGSAQVMGALHNVRPANASKAGNLGWAIGGGVIINLPMLSPDSNIAFQAQYADGALSYMGNAAGIPDYNNIDGSGTSDTNTGLSLSGGIYHQATSTIGLALDGSWADYDVSQSDPGEEQIPNGSRWAIDGSVQWEPVSGFAMGVDMGYANRDFDNFDGPEDEIKAGIRFQRTF
ncbi:porin, partial [Roseibium sp. RKSG952]|uniref:porin n=1 Tax=Roseibium sp. RKSG952 TaxID=2529384 RepID=UPI0012BB8604